MTCPTTGWPQPYWQDTRPRRLGTSEVRPGWLKQLVAEEDEEGTAEADKDEDPTADGTTYPTAMSPLMLNRLRRRKRPPRWSDTLTKLIEAHWGDVDGATATVSARNIWRVIHSCDSAGKKHLRQRAKEDKRKAKAKAKKASSASSSSSSSQRRGDWLVVEAMERHRARRAATPQRQWATAQFDKLAGMAWRGMAFEDWEMIALSAITSRLVLWASKASSGGGTGRRSWAA